MESIGKEISVNVTNRLNNKRKLLIAIIAKTVKNSRTINKLNKLMKNYDINHDGSHQEQNENLIGNIEKDKVSDTDADIDNMITDLNENVDENRLVSQTPIYFIAAVWTM